MQDIREIVFGYQPIRVEQEFIFEEGRLKWKLALSNTRAVRFSSRSGLVLPDDDLEQPFLWPLELNVSQLETHLIGHERANLPSRLSSIRGILRSQLRILLENTWMASGSGHYALSSSAQSAHNVWISWGPNRDRFVDSVCNASMTLLMDAFINNVFDCPNENLECTLFHGLAEEHFVTDIGAVFYTDSIREHGHIAVLTWVGDDWYDHESTYWAWNPTSVRTLLSLGDCYACEGLFVTSILRAASWFHGTDPLSDWMCNNCYDNSYIVECSECGEEIDEEYGRHTDDDEFICSLCSNDRRREENNLRLQHYSYKPSPIFHANGYERPFMGMELEVARSNREHTREVNSWINALPEDMFYVKADSSVQNGMEVVTHPFTYKWAEKNFPYDAFKDLISIKGVIANHESAGTHIHVEKAAFTSEHMWKYILFFIENKQFFGQLGERGHTHHYGSFSDSETIRKNLYKIVQAKGQLTSIVATGRGAINLNPQDTIELRFMAGNVRPEGIKKNQQLVQSVFDFTKMVRSGDAMKGALKDAGYFLGFLEDTDYPELKDFIQKITPKAKKLERTTN